MLQRIRDRITGWIAGAIIAVIGSAFIFWGVSAYFGQGASDQNAATVNGVAITHKQVNDYFVSLQQDILAKNNHQPLSQDMQSELKSYALQSVITQTALLTTLEQSGFRISLTQIKAMIEQAPQFQLNGQFSQTKFLDVLSQLNVSPSQFFQRMQSQWIITQVMNSFSASAFALPEEANYWYGVLNQQRAFGYLMIPVNNFLAKTNVTEQAIQQYYTDNSDAFKTPAKVRVDYLVLSPTAIEKTITVSEAEAKNYYEAHVQNYQVPASWTVTEITVPVANDASASVVTAAQQTAIKLRSA
ncbi:MAG TPA: SurA N-terminal domain-containing protein, partial [Coxiellaceae bacterium]|nr:SurA N-terminal domain-containing protein [Coxiellaceae bacterium]